MVRRGVDAAFAEIWDRSNISLRPRLDQTGRDCWEGSPRHLRLSVKRRQVSRGTRLHGDQLKTLSRQTHLVDSGRQSARNTRRQDAILSRVVQAFEERKLGRVGDGRRRERVDQLDDDVRVAYGVRQGVRQQGRQQKELGREQGKLTDDLALSVGRLRSCRQESARELSAAHPTRPALKDLMDIVRTQKKSWSGEAHR